MDQLVVNNVDYWLPKDVSEVIHLVNEAHAQKEVICLRGSAHSFPIIEDLERQGADGRKYKFVMLSNMNAVSIDTASQTVQVEAGCKLGLDPFDPTGISTLENSLCFKLDKKGLALPDLGGIIHQSVGGFLSTGSAGGTTEYSFNDLLLSIDIVHFGKKGAELITYTRPKDSNPNDPFYAIGLSMGLMGVITSVTLQCIPSFHIVGQEATTYVKDSSVDIYGDGGIGSVAAEQFLKDTQYTRFMWWPQENVHKLVVWQAKQATKKEAIAYAKKAYKKEGKKKHPQLKPYEEVPFILDSPTPATAAADLLFTAMGRWPDWLLEAMGDTLEYRATKKYIETLFYPTILPKLLDLFVKIDEADKGPQKFADTWWHGLPMDNQINDKLFPVRFTELWIPIDKSKDVFLALQKFYNNRPNNAYDFSCEVYAAKASKFWLSPSYETDVIRIDVFWFGNNIGNPEDYYQSFWKALSKFKFRPHWGKYLPAGDSKQGAKYLRSRYPKWKKWMKLREKLDPDQVFVNDYWRSHLDIKPNIKKSSKRSS